MRVAGFVVLLAGLTAAATTEDAGVPAGFRAYVVADDRYPPLTAADGKTQTPDPRNRTNKMHDLVTELGLDPVAAVFTRGEPAPDAPVTALLKKLDELPAAHRKQQDRGKPVRALRPFVVYLKLDKEYPEDEQRDAVAAKVKEVAAALKTPRVVYGLAAGKGPQADAWKLPDTAETVVVLYDRMQPVKRWELAAGAIPDDVLKAVADEANRMAGVK